VIKKPRERGDYNPLRAAELEKIIIIKTIIIVVIIITLGGET
jgi:hypothetical protein